MKDGFTAATSLIVQCAPRSSLQARCVWRRSGNCSSEVTYTRCVPGRQLEVATAQGVGPPTRTSTSPTSSPNGFTIGVWTKLRPPSSDLATCVPPACQATQTVPSERSIATDGSVAFVSASGDTCSVNASTRPPPALGAVAASNAASRAAGKRNLRIGTKTFCDFHVNFKPHYFSSVTLID